MIDKVQLKLVLTLRPDRSVFAAWKKKKAGKDKTCCLQPLKKNKKPAALCAELDPFQGL